MFRVIPNVLRDKINEKLDTAFLACPDAAKDRDVLYLQLIDYFDEHGVIPDFELQRKPKKE